MNNLMFFIDNAANLMFINNVWYRMTSNTLASNIAKINYNSYDFGAIVYNDRPPVPQAFFDPSPYQPYINNWITASAAATPALTLSQAKAIKAGLIDSVFLVKSQAPISVATSLGTFSFDVTPNDPTSILNVLTTLPAVTAQIAALNTAISNLASSINNNIVAGTNNELNVSAAYGNNVAAAFNGFNDANNAELLLLSQVNGNPYNPNPDAAFPVGYSGGVGGCSYSSPAALPAPFTTVKMMPIGQSSYPAFSINDLVLVLAAAATQFDNETAARATKQAALAGLGTIAAVVAYDATTGW